MHASYHDRLTRVARRFKDCDRCGLAKSRTKIALGALASTCAGPLAFGTGGGVEYRGMIIGEAPGVNEDKSGVPLSGDAGKWMWEFLKTRGVLLPMPNIYVVDSVACRPPENRKPETHELEACRDRLLMQIAALKPYAVLALGGTATGETFGPTPIAKVRGKAHPWFPFGSMSELTPALRDFSVELIATWHPSFLMRQGLPVDSPRGVSEAIDQFERDCRLFCDKLGDDVPF